MKHWLDEHLFHAEPDPARAAYSIVIPPPNITGVLHMGHALNDTIQDVLTRYHRMLGDNACWLVAPTTPGSRRRTWSRRRCEEGLSKEDLGRDEFVSRVREWRREYGGTIIEQLKRLGRSCDYERERFTFDDGYARAVTRVFVALYEKGYIHGQLPRELVPALRHSDQRPRGRLHGDAGTPISIRYDVIGGGA